LATEVQAPEHDPSGRGCAIAGMANRDDYRGLRGGWSPTDICELCAEPGAVDRARAAYARLMEKEQGNAGVGIWSDT
jgi:hypothetical protein